MTTREQIARGLRQSEVLALTLDAEARGGGREGMVSVGATIANRRAWGRWGRTWADVCLARKQFSCWNPDADDRNHRRLVKFANLLRVGQTPPELLLPLAIASDVIAGATPDPTGGADHYYNPAGMVPPGRVPEWAEGLEPTAIIADHLFFRLRPSEVNA